MSRETFITFLEKVTSRVKARGAHAMIKKELHTHMEELRKSYETRGRSREEAEELAVEQMGNPYTVGDRLNRIHKPRMDWILIALFAMLAGTGLLTGFGAASNLSLPASYFVERQAIWYAIALIFLVSVMFFDYRKLAKWCVSFYGAGLFLLAATSLFGVTMNGAQRWLAVGGLTIDGGMLALLFFLLGWAGMLHRIDLYKSWQWQIGLTAMLWAPAVIYLSMPYIVLAVIYLLFVTAMFLFSGAGRKTILTLGGLNTLAVLIVAAGAYVTVPGARFSHLEGRIGGFLNPNAAADGHGYMYMMVRQALSEAGWFGNGLLDTGHGLPEAHTDLAFVYLVYALGWSFGIFLCLLILAFVWRICRNTFKTPDHFGRLLVIGGAVMFSLPAVWNILMGLGILPIAGVSLPLVSYGGSMLLLYAIVLGLILNVYRKKDIIQPTM
ncbi:cell division protein FtsW [Alteribacter lacisalsi]|uniref:Cell division protein FtsW n=1 Tax=Alteribacter lacisalsi TaxID=2045244 RepID=A0A2W0HKK8_9BACI|nr:FtsW/RodA/SpoVE family cell cycle protein [Alteribacter lacisalsi]PYZ97632.1 cell division protein FtsW [Alteribacter lacisalsi]